MVIVRKFQTSAKRKILICVANKKCNTVILTITKDYKKDLN